jgi:hypothetical protein
MILPYDDNSDDESYKIDEDIAFPIIASPKKIINVEVRVD